MHWDLFIIQPKNRRFKSLKKAKAIKTTRTETPTCCAISMARSLSLGHSELEPVLKEDLGLASSKAQSLNCNASLVCVEAVDGDLRVIGISRK